MTLVILSCSEHSTTTTTTAATITSTATAAAIMGTTDIYLTLLSAPYGLGIVLGSYMCYVILHFHLPEQLGA